MSRKQLVVLVVVFIFIIAGSALGILSRNRENDNDNNQPPPVTPPPGPPKIDGYTPEVPKDIKLTPPTVEIPASPGNTTAKLRVFDMRVNQGGYDPAIFTVNKGDTVQIKMTSQDNDYDFSSRPLGLYQFAKKGETKIIAFGALNSGTFDFGCRDHCPVGKIIKGSIIVLP